MSRHSFDAHARKYDTWYDAEPGRTLFAMEVDCLRPFIDGDRPWLEVGVGSGRFARALGIILKESPWAEYYARLGREGHRIYRNARFYSRAEVETMLGRAGFGDLTYRSALTQPPGLTRYPPESPVDGYRQDAGFTAIKALKQ